MTTGLRRYEFGERLADILGESRRDLRFRVTMLVSGGLVPPGPRGRGSPSATPEYAAKLLLGCMAAPQQSFTIEAIRCYEDLLPSHRGAEAAAPRVTLGIRPAAEDGGAPLPSMPLLSGRRSFGEMLAYLIELATASQTRDTLARELFGIWVSRSYPVSAVQLGAWSEGQRSVITQRYELGDGGRPPAWLDPERDGNPDAGLYHTVFLSASKLARIGELTSFPHTERSPMINLGPRMARISQLAELVRQSRFRGRWEKLLETLATVKDWSDKVDASDSRLVEVRDFGSNPGQLRMLTYIPDHLPASAPLVVLLHGCTQSAVSFNKGTGWSTLADRMGFALLIPEQHWTNNPLRCFNWFRPEDTSRNSGEALSIRQMIDRMLSDHGLDHRRVYVTGLSSGGAMTSAMLATYPDVFAGGAVVAGVPYRTADSMQDAFLSIFQGRGRSAREWGDLVREASSHRGPWPRVSVWHGDSDSAVAPMNAEEIVKQWTDVHGIAGDPHIERTQDGHPHRIWRGPDGKHLVEFYNIKGMSHGAPLSTGEQPHQCGTAAPFFNDVGISSAFHIARFWGLHEQAAESVATADSRTDRAQPEVIDLSQGANAPQPELARADSARDATDDAAQGVAEQRSGSDEQGDRAEEAGRVIRADSPQPESREEHFSGSGRSAGGDSVALGIDVHGIVRKSLQAAGLIKGGEPDQGAGGAGRMPLGIDVPGIISTSLEAAGVLRSAAARSDASTPKQQPQDATWEGNGWEFLADDMAASREGRILHGSVSSGNASEVGRKVKSMSRRISLGPNPELSYLRRLRLNASVNDFTSASFSVLVDGMPVDEASAVGMEHVESEWLQRSDIDLGRFADRTVTLTFEVAAQSNVYSEVSAEAWIDRVRVKSVSPLC